MDGARGASSRHGSSRRRLDEIVANEYAVHRGAMPERPFVLVGQQYLADPRRSVGDIHPLWTYAHVPHGYSGDATEAIVDQIERYAPGFRDRIIGTAVRATTDMSVYNANYVGGDIIGGLSSPPQLLFRPRFAVDPYFTGIPGTYLCSASTPPGAGAHGLCGANAAARALAAVGHAVPGRRTLHAWWQPTMSGRDEERIARLRRRDGRGPSNATRSAAWRGSRRVATTSRSGSPGT